MTGTTQSERPEKAPDAEASTTGTQTEAPKVLADQSASGSHDSKVETMGDAARESVEAAKKIAERQVESAKSHLVSETEDAASRVRRAGEAFGTDSFAHAAADRIAENLTYAADAVRSTDLASLQSDLSAFARKNPLVFFGGAAALGFLAGRLLKASDDSGFGNDYAARESATYAASRGYASDRQPGYSR